MVHVYMYISEETEIFYIERENGKGRDGKAETETAVGLCCPLKQRRTICLASQSLRFRDNKNVHFWAIGLQILGLKEGQAPASSPKREEQRFPGSSSVSVDHGFIASPRIALFREKYLPKNKERFPPSWGR